MKKLLVLVGAAVALSSAFASLSQIEWIESSGKQWVNTAFYPAATDRIEMKVRYSTVEGTQCLFCSREGMNVRSLTCFLVSGVFRFDYNAGNTTTTFSPAAGTDYEIVADCGKGLLTIGGETVLESMGASDFSPGSKLTLFASHADGGNLSDSTTMGNWASYRLYYLKVFDKDGNLKHDYVPARNDLIIGDADKARYGLYDLQTQTYCPGLGSAVLAGGAVVSELIEDYVIDVPAGTERRLADYEIAAIGTKTLRKTGGGTLIAGSEMANFAGNILIADGLYKAVHSNAFGTAAGVTYVSGGTIWNTVNAPTTHTTEGGYPAFGREAFHLKGNGYNNQGVIYNTTDCFNFAGGGGITIDGDIRIGGTKTLDFRYGYVSMNGYKLTAAIHGGGFRLVALGLSNPGDIDVEDGYLELQSGTGDSGNASNVVRVKSGAQLHFWSLQTKQGRTLVLEPNTRIQMNAGKEALGDVNTIYGNWGGPVELQGAIPATIDKGNSLTFSGCVSGEGGISATGGGWLQFCCATNSYRGDIEMTGLAGADDLAVTGGVAVTANGALPTNTTGKVMIRNATLRLFNSTNTDLPDLVADGKAVVTGAMTIGERTFRSLTKTGAGTLNVFGPMKVLGDTDIQGGTIRFASRVPMAMPGLNSYYSSTSSGNINDTAVPNYYPSTGVDYAGASAAYKAWRTTTGADGAASHNQGYYYTGFIRIPGEEGEKVTCNFVSSIARFTRLIIDGVTVVKVSDNKDELNGITDLKWTRFSVGKPVELTAGWKTFFLYMGNTWQNPGGPVQNSGYGWVANFGVGVDWQGRCETNAANYVKFQDPGDASFLRPSMDMPKEWLDPSIFRPAFAGAVAFGPGTVLDINDVAPYTPVVMQSLTGTPTIRSGEVRVLGKVWKMRASDIGGTLTVEDDARLVFAAGTTLAFEGDLDAVPHRGADRVRPFVRIAADGTVENLPQMGGWIEGSNWCVVPAADGNGYDLEYSKGMKIYIR